MQTIQFSRRCHVLALHRYQCMNSLHVPYVLSGWTQPSLDLLPFHVLTPSIAHALVNGGTVGEHLRPRTRTYTSTLNSAPFIDVLSAGILKPSCPRILLHQLPPLFPCPSLTLLHRRSPSVPPARRLRTSGFVLSAAMWVVAATVELMRMHTIRLPLISMLWSLKHNAYGIMRVTVMCIA